MRKIIVWIVVSAGVVLIFLVGFVLFFVSYGTFPGEVTVRSISTVPHGHLPVYVKLSFSEGPLDVGEYVVETGRIIGNHISEKTYDGVMAIQLGDSDPKLSLIDDCYRIDASRDSRSIRYESGFWWLLIGARAVPVKSGDQWYEEVDEHRICFQYFEEK